MKLILSLPLLCGSLLAQEAWPDKKWTSATPAEVGMDEVFLEKARDYALSGKGSGYITRHGKLVMAWGDPAARYDLKSTTKSFGSIALGLAIKEGLVRLEDRAIQIHPAFGTPPEENKAGGHLDRITILHLAAQTAGFEKPGGYTPLLFPPGTAWDYSDSGPNWLAECLTLRWKRDLKEVMFDRVFTPLGIAPEDLVWRKNAYRPAEIQGIPRREFGSGISANVDAMARIGLLMLREGRWKDTQILTPEYVRLSTRTYPGHEKLPVHDPTSHGPDASHHYGLLWWTNEDEALEGVPLDAYWSWGLHDSLIVVIPSLDVVIARAGESWAREKGAAHYDVLKPFLVPVVQSIRGESRKTAQSPYPPSPVIIGIDWAPAASIIRQAPGSDNWPLTWADDDALYTAYGDGKGFAPMVERKLSLGLARIEGGPADFRAANLRSPTAEAIGDGKSGRKASGLLSVQGVLYLWVRNAGNSQLGWSRDHGKTWEWAEWKFTESFGAPSFLNYGKDGAGARDEYAYVYSHDSSSAYERADRMVLARVPMAKITDRSAYEFFRAPDDWTKDIARRGAVFTHPGQCYRSHVSYNAGLQRYLWCQTGAGKDTRYAGGIAIYDAPEPWGPWTLAYAADPWDVGPGESSSLPPKWMSADGLTVHLVFSGDDSFSVRRGRILLR